MLSDSMVMHARPSSSNSTSARDHSFMKAGSPLSSQGGSWKGGSPASIWRLVSMNGTDAVS